MKTQSQLGYMVTRCLGVIELLVSVLLLWNCCNVLLSWFCLWILHTDILSYWSTLVYHKPSI